MGSETPHCASRVRPNAILVAEHAVDLGAAPMLRNLDLHPGGTELSRRRHRRRRSNTIPSSRRARATGCRLPHRDERHRHPRAAAERAQRDAVAETRGRDRDFDDLGAACQHGERQVLQVGGDAREVVMRKDDAAAPGVSDRPRSCPAIRRRHIRRRGERLAEDGAPLFFRAPEVSALRRGATGDDDRLYAGRRARRRHSGLDRIQAKLYQVGVDDLIAPRTQLGRRVGRHGHAKLGRLHKITSSTDQTSQKKSASSSVKRRFGRASECVWCFYTDRLALLLGTNTTTPRTTRIPRST